MLPATIGFSDRHHGFIGGSYNNGTPLRYARTLTDESGLYSQRFWYDALGRIVLSQNTKQFNAAPQRFSYSLYDALGRVYEAGELDDDDPNALFRTHVPGMLVGGQFKPDVIDPAVLKPWVLAQGRQRREVTRTFYDTPLSAAIETHFTGNHQENLRLRVASTTYEDLDDGDPLTYDHATHYSYDIHGNVKELVQDIPQLGLDGGSNGNPTFADHRYKKLRYTYDLISGNVKQVDYQPGGDDQMHHRYEYDADNRITKVETTADAVLWHQDAEYFYYPHGPLQRVELGEHRVQGMDYAYTLQGWLKGINSARLLPMNDMGRDGVGVTSNPNGQVGRDAFGEGIGYYGDEDYKAIDAMRWGTPGLRPFALVGNLSTATGTLPAAYHPLYNGNIAHTTNSLQPFAGWSGGGPQAQVLAQVYKYDQLNRLKQAQGVEGLTSANTWDGVTDAIADRYKSQYTYDANGNILTADRWDADGNRYDELRYKYEGSDPNGTNPPQPSVAVRNRLYELYDNDADPTDDAATDDIMAPNDPGTTPPGTPHLSHDPGLNLTSNYRYDALGNLVHDTREEIANIEWTVSGKLKHITRTAGSTKPELWFAYGADGQRISKTVGDPLNGGYKEYYLRDAQGNIMATYKYADNGTSLKVTDRPVYGSSRIGSFTRQIELVGEQTITNYPYTQPMQAPLKRYELTDHLGNVAAVVTGRLLPGNGSGASKQAELISAQGYEPFGSLLPGRNYSSDSYRFGFQGQEKDNEVYGAEGTSYAFEYRMHDARVGRFLSIDPLASKYPHNSPYAFSENRVIDAIELEGRESIHFQTDIRYQYQFPLLAVTTSGALGVAVDIHGGVGIYLTPTLGIGEGAGLVGGYSFGFSTANVNERGGLGMNIGFGATEKISGLGAGWNGEFNYAFDKDGGPGNSGFTRGIWTNGNYMGGYWELSYTFIATAQIGDLSDDVYSMIEENLGWNRETTDQMLVGLQKMAIKETEKWNDMKQNRGDDDQRTPPPVKAIQKQLSIGNMFKGLFKSIGLSPGTEPPKTEKDE